MPNRIIKESICTSDNIDRLSNAAEIAFYRLIVNCDDYGRMDARPNLLVSRLFPLKRGISDETMSGILDELADADLILLYEVNGHPYLLMKTWKDHQQIRNKKSKYPSPDDIGCGNLQSIDINCNQLQSIDRKCPRNPIQSNPNPNPNQNRNPTPLVDDADAGKIQEDHDHVLNAATDAGFKMSNDVRDALIALYAENGLNKMLAGFKACVEHGVPTLAYLKAVLKGEPKKTAAKGSVPAQQYTQRSYDGEQEDAMRRMLRVVSNE